MSYFTRFAHLLNGDPDQPRDELGRWTSTGSGGSGSVEVSRQAQAQIDRLNVTAFAKATGASPVELTEKFQRGTGVDLRIDNVEVSGRNRTFVDWTIMKDGRKIGAMTRSWSPDGTIVSHEEIEILPRYQNEGLGRALTGKMFARCRESDVKLVRLSAAPDLGNYVWARAGFALGNETAEYMQTGLRWNLDRYVHDKSLREKARPLIDDMAKDPKTIWKIADLSDKVVRRGQEMPLGRALLMDLQWFGSIRLDDTEAMARLDAWVKARPLRKAEPAPGREDNAVSSVKGRLEDNPRNLWPRNLWKIADLGDTVAPAGQAQPAGEVLLPVAGWPGEFNMKDKAKPTRTGGHTDKRRSAAERKADELLGEALHKYHEALDYAYDLLDEGRELEALAHHEACQKAYRRARGIPEEWMDEADIMAAMIEEVEAEREAEEAEKKKKE